MGGFVAKGGGFCLNESPPEKEGKFPAFAGTKSTKFSLNESPPEKEGK